MMYHNKLAIAVKSNGKVLREFNKDTVYVPFGSEYTILIKNLNTVRVQVRVEIDGTDATEGTWLVVNPNSEMELTRFIKNGNLNQGNRFKFIERTASIESGPRGAKVEDGLIRVEYQFERVTQPSITYWPSPREQWVKKEYWEKEYVYDWSNAQVSKTALVGSALRGISLNAAGAAAASSASFSASLPSEVQSFAATASSAVAPQNATLTTTLDSMPVNDVGITVPGSISDQKFHTVSSFLTESTTHVMVIKLLGETAQGKQVKKPVTVKAKPTCTTCGRVNKANAKFCTECGTSLEIV